MQTFLPYTSFKKSAQSLDMKRLGKQRVECYQILKALHDPSYGWQNHPAVKMWKGYEMALVEYGLAICDEWISRGYKDTCKEKICSFYSSNIVKYPDFIHDNRFLLSHRSNLIRKNPEYYRKLWPDVQSNLEYIWPN